MKRTKSMIIEGALAALSFAISFYLVLALLVAMGVL